MYFNCIDGAGRRGRRRPQRGDRMRNVTVASLVVAAAGVVIQIVSGVPYPAVPPVFFILLVPAGLVAFARWRWTPILALPAALFLLFGLVATGESARLFDPSRPGGVGGSIGLWVQMLGVVVAGVSGVVATVRSDASRARTAGI
jgi:hypothetical protein